MLRVLVTLVLAFGASAAVCQGPAKARAPGPAVVLSLSGEVHAVAADYIASGLGQAARDGAPFVVLVIDTPGGRLDATRDITRAILASKVPVVGFVSPPGAQAASAGFLVLMACDVAAMAPGTNAGAASPVGGEGQDLGDTLKKKVSEDVSALLRSVVAPRGRPVDAAVATIAEAKSYSETEAFERKLVEVVARDLPDLLEKLDGLTAKRVGRPDAVLAAGKIATREIPLTRLQKVVGVIANPAITSLLFLVGLVGIYSELQHPGAIFPGVLGAVCLLLALFAMSVLPTNAAGIALILLGVLFFVLEVKLTAHGLLAISGGVAVVLGAVLLFHQSDFAPRGELVFVAGAGVAAALVMAGLSFAALAAQRRPIQTGDHVLLGQVIPVRAEIDGLGKVFVDGAIWTARSRSRVPEGALVRVVGVDGLVLDVDLVRSAERAEPNDPVRSAERAEPVSPEKSQPPKEQT